MNDEKVQIINLIRDEISVLEDELREAETSPALAHEVEVCINTLSSLLQRIDREVKSPQMELPFQEYYT